MLAKKRSLSLNGTEVERTPLLVPAFSSKGFPEVADILEYSSELISGPMLVSAYDLHYKKITPPFDFASLIFLDSGGYEATRDLELPDLGEKEHVPEKWPPEYHQSVLETWKPLIPSVVTSYDHPSKPLLMEAQIERARQIAPNRSDVLREILLKPETEGSKRVRTSSVIKHIHALASFDLIGITEKEIGSTLIERMKSIGLIRMALDRAGLNTPIHMFGNLDPITTPMYFLVGADVFDGLSWLRFAFDEGHALYKQNYWATIPLDTKTHVLDGICWNKNYRYMQTLQEEMRRFLLTGNFACFKFIGDRLQHALETAMEAIGAEDGTQSK